MAIFSKKKLLKKVENHTMANAEEIKLACRGALTI
jgi:hypothetical protein